MTMAEVLSKMVCFFYLQPFIIGGWLSSGKFSTSVALNYSGKVNQHRYFAFFLTTSSINSIDYSKILHPQNSRNITITLLTVCSCNCDFLNSQIDCFKSSNLHAPRFLSMVPHIATYRIYMQKWFQ